MKRSGVVLPDLGGKTIMSRLPERSLRFLPVLAVAAIGCTSINMTVTDLEARRGSLYASAGLIDSTNTNIGPGACAGTPTPAAPDVQGWWAGIDTATRSRVVVTGFEIWSNTLASCPNARQDMYRGVFGYDLARIAALSTPGSPIASRINEAKLTFTIQGGNGRRSVSTATCFESTGGVQSIGLLDPAAAILTGLTSVQSLPMPPAFPAQVLDITDLFSLSVPGHRGRTTTSVGGLGVTVVEVDVKDLLLGALNRGDARLGFILTGTAERAVALAGDAQLDCKTFVAPGTLTVKSL